MRILDSCLSCRALSSSEAVFSPLTCWQLPANLEIGVDGSLIIRDSTMFTLWNGSCWLEYVRLPFHHEIALQGRSPTCDLGLLASQARDKFPSPCATLLASAMHPVRCF